MVRLRFRLFLDCLVELLAALWAPVADAWLRLCIRVYLFLDSFVARMSSLASQGGSSASADRSTVGLPEHSVTLPEPEQGSREQGERALRRSALPSDAELRLRADCSTCEPL